MAVNRQTGVLVRISCNKSRRFGALARWLPEKTWSDKEGNVWHLLEFGDETLCSFPRDEFEVVEELAQI